jgi:hypothetical protein
MITGEEAYQMLRLTFRYIFFTYYGKTIFLRMDLGCSESDTKSLFRRLFHADVFKQFDVIIQKEPGSESRY